MHAIDERLVHVDFDLARIHVDDGRDAGAREAAAGRHRRDHLAGLRILRDDHAVERRAHQQIVEILRAHAHGACGDLHFALQRFQPRAQRADFGLRLVELRLADELVGAQCSVATQVAFGFGQAHLHFLEILARGFELALRELVDRPRGRVVEPRQELAFLDGHAFLDQHFGDLAGDFRGHRRLAPRNDVARCIQNRGAATAAGRARDRGGRFHFDGAVAQQRIGAGDDARARARRRRTTCTRLSGTGSAGSAVRSIRRLSRAFWSKDIGSCAQRFSSLVGWRPRRERADSNPGVVAKRAG